MYRFLAKQVLIFINSEMISHEHNVNFFLFLFSDEDEILNMCIKVLCINYLMLTQNIQYVLSEFDRNKLGKKFWRYKAKVLQ